MTQPATVLMRRIIELELTNPDDASRPWSLRPLLACGPVVLLVYRGDWCPYCCVQLADYGLLHAEFDAAKIGVIGISTDSAAQISAIRRRLFLPFELLLDENGRESRKLGAWSEAEGCPLPTTVLLDRQGNVVRSQIGRDPGDRPLAHEILATAKEIG